MRILKPAQLLYEVSAASQRVIAPGLRYSQLAYEERLRAYAMNARRWLDVGCGHHLLVPWREAEEIELCGKIPLLVGLDYDLPSLQKHRSITLRVKGDVGRLPFPDGSFDFVTANMVVEHLDRPEAQFAEIGRVLSAGGIFLFHTPNLFGYPAFVSRLLPEGIKKKLAYFLEGREEADIFPTHYKSNRESDIRALAQSTGFRVEAIEFVASLPAFNRIPPLAIAELLYLRAITSSQRLAFLRQTLIVALQKPRV
jgi:SAM-dependent methyltransferase